jgi:O-antigen/teichoic acid export membrane protein
LASLVCVLGSIPYCRQLWHEGHRRLSLSTPQREFWIKLLPFAGWIWLTNLLSNLFDVIDRYMIIHHSTFSPDEALRQVGYYHSSRLLPLLFVAITGLLSSIVTPHLTHDWESGNRQAVSSRLNTILKALMLSLFGSSVLLLIGAPLLFNFALEGKFTRGLDLLPLTLAYCSWFGAIAVAQNYLWCAERAWLGSLGLMIGLVINVLLELVLLPRFGLLGAVLSTSAANFTTLFLTYLFCWRFGMKIDRGVWLLSAAPVLLWFGPLVALIGLVAILLVSLMTNRLFDHDEKNRLLLGFAKYLPRLTQPQAPLP